MCGICGALGAGIDQDTLERATDLMWHRGPDEAGYYCDDSVALGMRRLSIIDLAGGQQPKTDERGRYQVIFNGEIYNYRELRDELRRDGHAFQSTSDTEVIAHAYEAWGTRAFARLNGIFAIAIWDREARELVLARDHLGVKPLYYTIAGNAVIFGSELKPLLALMPNVPAIDPYAAAMMLRYSYIPAPRSIFVGVDKLLPAHYLVARLDGTAPTVHRFWDPLNLAVTPKDGISVDEAEQLVHDTLLRAVRRQMVSEVPLGAFLSGGIDSSTVVAMMQATGATTKTFSIGFDDDETDESRFAGVVAKHLGTDHYSWTVRAEDALTAIPKMWHFYDEPFGDSSQIPTYLVSRLAREHVTVSLSGDGGDELFSGYTRYDEIRRVHHIWRIPHRVRRGMVAGLNAAGGLIGERKLTRGRILLTPDISEAYRNRVSVTRDPLLADLSHLGAGAHVANPEWPDHAFSGRNLAQAMMLTDLVTYLPDDILTKVDRASMAVSLEARVPILDPEVVELAFSIPSTVHLAEGPKTLLKRVLRRYVPAEIFERPKHGFGIPIHEWPREALRDCVTGYLSADALNRHGLFHTENVTDLVDAHLDGRVQRGYVLWNLLMFQMWYDEWYLKLGAGRAKQPVPMVSA